MRIVDTLKQILGAVPAGPAPMSHAATVAVPDDAPDEKPAETHSGLDAMLAAHGAASRPVTAGSIEIVGLEDVKRAYGNAWTEVSDQARAIALGEIQSQLTDKDFVEAQSDTRFVICFADLSAPNAVQRTRLITRLIKSRLVNELPALGDKARIENFVAQVDPSNLSPDGRSLADRLAATLERMQCEVEIAASEQRRIVFRDFQLYFAPLWDTADHTTPISRCVLDEAQYARMLNRMRGLADGEQVDRAMAEFDYLMLTRAIERIHAARHADSPPSLMIPVGWRTLATEDSQNDYLRLLQSVPLPYRSSIVLEIGGLEASATIREVLGLTEVAKRGVNRITLQLPFESPLLPMLQPGDVYGVTCSLSPVNVRDKSAPPHLQRFAAVARDAHMASFALNANSLGLAMAAVGAGFTHIGGSAIHLNQPDPRPAVRMKPVALVDRSIAV